jgi:SNF2 family DNA or RNA helicase
MPHQVEGVEFLLRRGSGLLAFEQGLGKTLVAIESFRQVLEARHADQLLVLCPNSLKRNWEAELVKFAPGLACVIVEGSPVQRRRQFAEARSPVVITSYETARSEVTAIIALLKRRRTVLVLDESHATKNRTSLTSTAARHFAPLCSHRWLLSGTPVTNSPSDLHTQVGLVAPEPHPLGSAEAFVAAVESSSPAERERAVARAQAFVLRKTKELCLDLPDKLFVDRRVELPPWQRQLYDEMRDQMVCEIRAMNGEQYRSFASTALVQLTRLCQIASNPGLALPAPAPRVPGKWVELAELVRDILGDEGRKVIIWSSYVESIERLLEQFADAGAVALYGGTEASERQAVAQRFQTDPSCRVMLANPAAAGTGFTLTAANYTIYESMSWRYDFYAQSQDRNHRIGQSLPVTYVRLIAVDTIEEAIVEALERKAGMARALLGDPQAKPSLGDLTREEMCELLLSNKLPKGTA